MKKRQKKNKRERAGKKKKMMKIKKWKIIRLGNKKVMAGQPNS